MNTFVIEPISKDHAGPRRHGDPGHARIERSHYLGFSWSAKLGFAIGEHAPERVLSLVLCGNQPYAWPTEGPMLRAVTDAVAAGRERGILALVET